MRDERKPKKGKTKRKPRVNPDERWRSGSDRWDAFRGRNFPGYVPLYGEYTPITVRPGTVMKDEYLKSD